MEEAVKLSVALAVLQDALKEQIAKTEDVKDFCTMTVMPGSNIPLDSDCRGMAWVRLVSAVPSSTFPQQTTTPGNCGSFLAYSVEMAMFRRAPQMRKFGSTVTVPTNEENFIAAEKQLDDIQTMVDAMRSVENLFPDFLLGSYVPQGPEGGVVGGVWSLSIGLD